MKILLINKENQEEITPQPRGKGRDYSITRRST
jgi:hypothetical protein